MGPDSLADSLGLVVSVAVAQPAKAPTLSWPSLEFIAAYSEFGQLLVAIFVGWMAFRIQRDANKVQERLAALVELQRLDERTRERTRFMEEITKACTLIKQSSDKTVSSRTILEVAAMWSRSVELFGEAELGDSLGVLVRAMASHRDARFKGIRGSDAASVDDQLTSALEQFQNAYGDFMLREHEKHEQLLSILSPAGRAPSPRPKPTPPPAQ